MTPSWFNRNVVVISVTLWKVIGMINSWLIISLRWRHNDHDSVSNHQPHGCLLNRLFRRRSKKTSKLRVTGLCVGNSPGTSEFPTQMASYAENVFIWWRHHARRTTYIRVVKGNRGCLTNNKLSVIIVINTSSSRYGVLGAYEINSQTRMTLWQGNHIAVPLWRESIGHFPHYWPFVTGIHRWLVDSAHKGTVMRR